MYGRKFTPLTCTKENYAFCNKARFKAIKEKYRPGEYEQVVFKEF
jgi:hypothetical protein